MDSIIKHVFLDLDRTLWDFNANSRLELKHLFEAFQLQQKGISLVDEFIKVYEKINNECWAKYRKGTLTKEKLRAKRFNDTLEYFGIVDAQLSEEMGAMYIKNSPNRTLLVDGTIELLDYLKNKYTLHIITNGFWEVQHLKLNNCKIAHYFELIITSEEVGVMKPNPKVFNFSLEKANAKKEESVYVGDSFEVDIVGATNAGMHAIYYNPSEKQHPLDILGDVKHLQEIKDIL